MSKDKTLIERLMRVGERIAIPCPDGIKGCAVLHFRVETDPACKEAADQIEADGQRIAELEAALRQIARLRTDLRGDFSLGSKQSDIARAALGEK